MVTGNGLKPLIKWSGGKHRDIKYFCNHYPPSFDRYIEPFVGGGAVFFDIGFHNNVISDVHPDLINFYQQIKNGNSEAILNIVSEFDCSENTYYFVRDKFDVTNDIDRAAVFYYLRKTAFRGMLRYNSNGKFNIPWGRYKSVDYSDLYDKRYEFLLKNTDIRCDSFENIFRSFNDTNNFMFIDPPYDSVFKDYGYCKFGKDYQEKLCELFKQTSNKCLIVIGKSNLVDELYKGYIAESYIKKYSFRIHSGRVGNEINNIHLIIKNY